MTTVEEDNVHVFAGDVQHLVRNVYIRKHVFFNRHFVFQLMELRMSLMSPFVKCLKTQIL